MKPEISRAEFHYADVQGRIADQIVEGLNTIEEGLIRIFEVESDDVIRITLIRKYVRGGAKEPLEKLLDGLGIPNPI